MGPLPRAKIEIFSIMRATLRGETFVMRKIAQAVASIALGQQNSLYLGNLDARPRTRGT